MDNLFLQCMCQTPRCHHRLASLTSAPAYQSSTVVPHLGRNTQKSSIHRCSTQHAKKPDLAGSRHVTPLKAEAYGTRKTVVPNRLCCQVLSVLMYRYRPGQLPCRATLIKWGAAGWGKYNLFIRPPWTACVVHFRDLYPLDFSHLSFNFLCLLLLWVSISMGTL